MDITVMSEPKKLGKVWKRGDIQKALLVYLDDSLGLRGNKAFQDYLRHSISYTLGIDVSEIRIAGIPDHLYRDGIQFVVSKAIYDRLDKCTDDVELLGDIVISAIDGYTHQRDNPHT